MATKALRRTCLGMLTVAALGSLPAAARGEFREIGYQSEEQWSIPWCDTSNNGPVIVPVKNNMQVSSQGYYHFYAFVVNSGSNTCGVDLEYAHFPRGTNPDQPGTTDGASEVRMRSFLITADAWGLVDSGPVGYCSPGDGGYLQLNTWPDPDLDLRLIWPDGTEYYAVAMNFPCE